MPKKKDLSSQKHFIALNDVLITAEERERSKLKVKEVKE